MARTELLPHQEGAQAAVERALRYAPGLRQRLTPHLDELRREHDIPDDYAALTPAAAVQLMRLVEIACSRAGISAYLFPCTRTGWREAAARWGVFVAS